MIICLLRLAIFWTLNFFSGSSLFEGALNNYEIVVETNNFAKSSSMNIILVNYETDVVYTEDLAHGVWRIKSDGVIGYKVDGTDIFLIEPVNEVKEVGIGPLETVFGSTTGYGADCVGCSGNVACNVPGGHNLVRDGIYYDDASYGSVRIIAADNALFSCGTIIEVDNGIIAPFYAIVLDTGSAMRKAWRDSGSVLIDIAFSNENYVGINNATNKTGNVKFKVYRYGW